MIINTAQQQRKRFKVMYDCMYVVERNRTLEWNGMGQGMGKETGNEANGRLVFREEKGNCRATSAASGLEALDTKELDTEGSKGLKACTRSGNAKLRLRLGDL